MLHAWEQYNIRHVGVTYTIPSNNKHGGQLQELELKVHGNLTTRNISSAGTAGVRD